MHQTFNLFIVLLLPVMLGSALSLASPLLSPAIAPSVNSARDMSPRTSDTCADPSLARTIFQAYSGINIAHTLAWHYGWVNVDSKQPSAPALWTLQGPTFKAWPTQQPSTVPLFRLNTPSGSDYLVAVGADAQTPPTVSGFNSPSTPLAWVYNTPDCGGVPLMSLVLPGQTDHYYTTDPDERDGLLAAGGWTNGGVVAYVLPF